MRSKLITLLDENKYDEDDVGRLQQWPDRFSCFRMPLLACFYGAKLDRQIIKWVHSIHQRCSLFHHRKGSPCLRQPWRLRTYNRRYWPVADGPWCRVCGPSNNGTGSRDDEMNCSHAGVKHSLWVFPWIAPSLSSSFAGFTQLWSPVVQVILGLLAATCRQNLRWRNRP